MSMRAVRARGVRLSRPVVTRGPREPGVVSVQLATSRGFLLCELVRPRLDLMLVFGLCSVLQQPLGFTDSAPLKFSLGAGKKKKSCFWLVSLSSAHFLQVAGDRRVVKGTAVILRGTDFTHLELLGRWYKATFFERRHRRYREWYH